MLSQLPRRDDREQRSTSTVAKWYNEKKNPNSSKIASDPRTSVHGYGYGRIRVRIDVEGFPRKIFPEHPWLRTAKSSLRAPAMSIVFTPDPPHTNARQLAGTPNPFNESASNPPGRHGGAGFGECFPARRSSNVREGASVPTSVATTPTLKTTTATTHAALTVRQSRSRDA